ncbi:MSMEG_0567/Sll0786 family nitrogen starvation N-acetyltransferase [Desertivirga xinjiangensis]|uniref:MSMEG_0567/Sll0786 family nitrogen starvation N-acetyltransferase n=1 Tax=Desertivirga xinjiangensis TaxID=539206 RepID=UPI00210BD9B4|nr:MSMEG_0567/Sll0786 family nitrogen starvation N-acetyltransferase [Pedobacter xinjiangensis]
MIIESPQPYKANYITFDFAREKWQLNQYWELRTKIFCQEQQIFSESDKDEIDDKALPIIAECSYGGQLDQVVGVVRIDEREPGIWWGSRLGVAEQYRQMSRFNTFGLFNTSHPVHPFTMNLGGALIYKAVSTALAFGCQEFYAYVQEQNVNFFSRMHWKSLGTEDLFGRTHHFMRCELDFYAPSQPSIFQLNIRKAA